MRGLLTGENNHENRTSIYKLSPAVQLIIRQPIGRLKLKRATAVTANTDCGGEEENERGSVKRELSVL